MIPVKAFVGKLLRAIACKHTLSLKYQHVLQNRLI